MFRASILASAILIASCGSSPDPGNNTTAVDSDPVPSESGKKKKKKHLPAFSSDFKAVTFDEMDLDPGNDSLWYHLVLDIAGDKMLAVAQPTDENDRRGIRMQLITMDSDSGFSIHTESSPGYDSAKLYPTFFMDSEGRLIILGDTGERQSWGQKVYLLDDGTFYDLGFIDMGEVAYTEGDTEGEMVLAPTSIADRVTIHFVKNGLDFRLSEKDLVLFDDTEGHLDTIVDAKAYYYRLDRKGRFELKKTKS